MSHIRIVNTHYPSAGEDRKIMKLEDIAFIRQLGPVQRRDMESKHSTFETNCYLLRLWFNLSILEASIVLDSLMR